MADVKARFDSFERLFGNQLCRGRDTWRAFSMAAAADGLLASDPVHGTESNSTLNSGHGGDRSPESAMAWSNAVFAVPSCAQQQAARSREASSHFSAERIKQGRDERTWEAQSCSRVAALQAAGLRASCSQAGDPEGTHSVPVSEVVPVDEDATRTRGGGGALDVWCCESAVDNTDVVAPHEETRSDTIEQRARRAPPPPPPKETWDWACESGQQRIARMAMLRRFHVRQRHTRSQRARAMRAHRARLKRPWLKVRSKGWLVRTSPMFPIRTQHDVRSCCTRADITDRTRCAHHCFRASCTLEDVEDALKRGPVCVQPPVLPSPLSFSRSAAHPPPSAFTLSLHETVDERQRSREDLQDENEDLDDDACSSHCSTRDRST